MLPAPLAELIGRDEEVAAAEALLGGPARLVTMTGPGGVGKTRLAVEVARRLATRRRDGGCFVSLAPIADPADVPSAVARAIGVGEEADRTLVETLVAALGGRQILLVLDNFEHVLAAAPVVSELLAGAHEVEVLATSRAPLHLSGEHELPVPPLDFPRGREASARAVSSSPAVRLFVERARAASPTFALSDLNAGDVVAICRRLDGVPLAIELAAARARLLSPRELSERLERPFEVLTGGPTDLPARQQTLLRTIEWSYGLLDEPAQQVLTRLAVFHGGCTLAAAEAVAGPIEHLSTLVDRSLVGSARGTDDEVRLDLLETIRGFALERLATGGGESSARDAHADLYLGFADDARPHLDGPDQDTWVERLETEHDNLRAALRWSEGERRLRLAAALWRFWLMRGHLTEGRRWLAGALADAPDGALAVRAEALLGAGYLSHFQNAYAEASEHFTASLALARERRDRAATAAALAGLATVTGRTGDPHGARDRYAEALAIARELGDRAEVARLLERLGTMIWYTGDAAGARPALEESRALAAELGSPRDEAAAVQALGWLALEEDDAEGARELLERAAATSRELGDRWSTARALFGLGLAASSRGRLATARDRYSEALALVAELGDRFLSCACLGGFASLALEGGRAEPAAELYGAAEGLRRAIGATHSALVQRAHERGQRTAREALGEDAFERRWRQGLGLSFEDAIALAQGEAARTARERNPAGLTTREVEVLSLIADGLTDGEVAERLVLSVRTVNAHLRSIYRKLDVSSRAGATRWAVEHEVR